MNDAYRLGLAYGKLFRAMEQASKDMIRGFAAAAHGAGQLDEAMQKTIRVDRYKRRIERKRQLGLSYVKQLGRKKRRELGLEE